MSDVARVCREMEGEKMLLAEINKRIHEPFADDGEDTLCLEILLQQSDSISRTNKLFVSSSKPAF